MLESRTSMFPDDIIFLWQCHIHQTQNHLFHLLSRFQHFPHYHTIQSSGLTTSYLIFSSCKVSWNVSLKKVILRQSNQLHASFFPELTNGQSCAWAITVSGERGSAAAPAQCHDKPDQWLLDQRCLTFSQLKNMGRGFNVCVRLFILTWSNFKCPAAILKIYKGPYRPTKAYT